MKGGEFVLEASIGSCSVTASFITFVFLLVTAMESFQVAKNGWVYKGHREGAEPHRAVVPV